MPDISVMKNFTIVAVIGDRMLQITSDGTKEGTVFQGLQEDIVRIKEAADNHTLISFGEPGSRPIVYAGYDNPIRLVASVFSVLPEKTHLTKCPREVQEFFGNFPMKRRLFRVS